MPIKKLNHKMRAWFLIVLLYSTLGQSQDLKTELDSLLIGFNGNNPGIAVSIVKNGQAFHSIHYGYQNIGKKQAFTSDTRSNLASVSKHITAYWIFHLIKQNKLSLDDPITKHLDLPKEYEDVKIKHLINHTSGLREFHTIRQLRGKRVSKPFKPKEILNYLKDYPGLSYAPGTKHTYSNTGYFLLYLIAQKVGDWTDFAKSIGLKTSFWEDGTSRKKVASLYTYTSDFNRVKFEEKVGGYSNCHMTSQDLTVLMTQVLSNDAFLQTLEIKDSVHNENLPYTYGLIRSTWQKHTVYYHGGIIKGSRSFIVYVPKLKISVAITLNSDVVDPSPYAYKVLEYIVNGVPRAESYLLLQGQVVDNNGKGVPHCQIFNDISKGPMLTNDSGYFSYQLKEWKDTIRFVSRGYQTQNLHISNFTKPRLVDLGKKIITPILINTKIEKIQVRRHHSYPENPEYYSFAPQVNIAGAELLKRFSKVVANHPKLFVDTVHVYITPQGNPHGKFRYVIYKSPSPMGIEDVLYQSPPQQLSSSLSHGWHHHAIERPLSISDKHDLYVGIQWLDAAGSKGDKGVFVGFDPDQRSYSSYYRVAFNEWRSVGAIMYRGPRDMLINISTYSNKDYTPNAPELSSYSYLFDTMYHRVLPYALGLKLDLGIELYPNSRVYELNMRSSSTWSNDDKTWKFEANMGRFGYYEFYEVFPDRINKDYQVNYLSGKNSKLSNDKKWTKLYAFNKKLKWKLKSDDQNLTIKIRAFRKMEFKHYVDGIYYLPGDHSFGRLLFVNINDKGQIVNLNYVDSRNLNIQFVKDK